MRCANEIRIRDHAAYVQLVCVSHCGHIVLHLFREGKVQAVAGRKLRGATGPHGAASISGAARASTELVAVGCRSRAFPLAGVRLTSNSRS